MDKLNKEAKRMKKICRTKSMWLFMMAFMSLIFFSQTARADVSPGEVVDKTNWEKIEGMVPEQVLEWVKRGDYVLNIGSLKLNPKELYPKEALEANKTNIGKYDVDKEGGIIDVKTGKLPEFIIGFPFPDADIDKDPEKAPVKILHNTQYSRYCTGHLRASPALKLEWINPSALERRVEVDYTSGMYSGYSGAKDIPNPERFIYKNIVKVTAPYDVAGTAVLLWRYQDNRRDVNFSYIPAIRRVRRMSPASRSDAFLGSDLCFDDTAGYDGKIQDFIWKAVRTQTAVVPWCSDHLQLLVKPATTMGWGTTKDMVTGEYGYNTKGWKGKPWALTNGVWVKTKVFIIDGTPKDPYYNYGRTVYWLETERFGGAYKIIFDRAGRYWKTGITPLVGTTNPDGTYKNLEFGMLNMIDDRNQHASLLKQNADRSHYWVWMMQDMDLGIFDLGGFVKYCK